MFQKLDLTATSQRCTASDNLEILKTAITSRGVLYVKFKGNSDASVFDSVSRLFQVPESSKTTIKREGFLRGYIGLGQESGSSLLEVKEGFAYGFSEQVTAKNPLVGSNVWPKEFEMGDRKVLEQFLIDCQTLTKILTEMLSLTFTGSPTIWPDLCKEDREQYSIMRAFHYFPATKHKDLGSSQHTDWGFLTIIKAKEVIPGLQFANRAKNGSLYQWINVPAIPPGEDSADDWFVVNGGDFLSMMTNGLALSPLHRVISTLQERTSLVYFAYPSYHSSVPSFQSSALSFFADQTSEAIGERKTGNALKDSTCFGDFINEKWKSVGRSSY